MPVHESRVQVRRPHHPNQFFAKASGTPRRWHVRSTPSNKVTATDYARHMRGARAPPAPPLGQPGMQGLYDPWFEHEACGVGFVVDMKGRKSHRILQQAIDVLRNLDHRGACGCEANTGDGAGVLIQMPHAFFQRVAKKDRLMLPGPGETASGLVFLPRNPTKRRRLTEVFEYIIQSEGLTVLGWRTVPTNNSSLGETAKVSEPFIRQVFIGRNPAMKEDMAFERKLYVIRKRAYSEIRTSTIDGAEYWYLPSLSYKTIVYKGMLLTEQLAQYFTDLQHPAVETALALVHSRFSTNTFPSWDRAHPYRYLAHNGEINTLRGNYNWMKAREALSGRSARPIAAAAVVLPTPPEPRRRLSASGGHR